MFYLVDMIAEPRWTRRDAFYSCGHLVRTFKCSALEEGRRRGPDHFIPIYIYSTPLPVLHLAARRGRVWVCIDRPAERYHQQEPVYSLSAPNIIRQNVVHVEADLRRPPEPEAESSSVPAEQQFQYIL
jgi:hypothetical protein